MPTDPIEGHTCSHGCCGRLSKILNSRRARERRQYAKNPEKYRAKALRSYHGRPTKPTGPSGPLPEPDPT